MLPKLTRRPRLLAGYLVLGAELVCAVCHFGGCYQYHLWRGDDTLWRLWVDFVYVFDRPAYFFDWYTGIGYGFAYSELSPTHWILDYAVYVIVTAAVWYCLVLGVLVACRSITQGLSARSSDRPSSTGARSE